MIEVEAFANYVGEDYETSDRQEDLNRSLYVASALMLQEMKTFTSPMEGEIFDQCVLDLALALYQRSQNNNGQYSTDSPAGPLDPFMRINPILNRYRVKGI